MILTVFSLLVAISQVSGQVSVSGLSSGGFMAVQYHIAYSSEVIGAGVFAGGPYYCAQAQLTNALIACMSMPTSINVNTLISYATTQATKMTIDNPKNLANHRMYLFSGTKDTTVYPGVMTALQKFYANFQTNASNIYSNFNMAAAHAMITNDFGNTCAYKGAPYINNCDFDGAGAVLNWIYGTLKAPVTASTSNIETLGQGQFAPSGWSVTTMSMGANAYYYLPSGGCTSNAPCSKIHIVFHGCSQTTADIQMKYVENTGYNEWAESNNIIVLYPQAAKSYWNPSNANGCWDWWGYTNSAYSLQSGVQMSTVYNMVNYLKSEYGVESVETVAIN